MVRLAAQWHDALVVYLALIEAGFPEPRAYELTCRHTKGWS
jgi:hypothetical protein